MVGATPADPAAALPAGGAGGTGARAAVTRLRFVLIGLGGALFLAALLLSSYELAAARVPQHRAALEELIRQQTGLEVRFNSLLLRWGWYGPEAVFQDVELGEPQGAGRSAGMLLRAPRLIVGLDAWRMVRSGHLEAGRITLENPDITLTAGPRSGASAAAPAQVAVRTAGARILARWRGGRINIEGGTLRTALPGSPQIVTLGIRRAELRRVNADWSAQAQVALPQTLGASAHLSLQMRGDPSVEISSAALSFEGRGLQLAGWRALAGIAGERYLPLSGSGDFDVHATFVQGRLRSAAGKLAAEALEWRASSTAAPPLALGPLRGRWQLARRGAEWHLTLDALELGAPLTASAAASSPRPAALLHTQAPPPASVVVDAAAGGSELRARVQHAPLAALASLARWYAPQLPAAAVILGGEAHELEFDWSARRAPGTRLALSAEFQALTLASGSGGLVLSGLAGRISGGEDTLAIALHSPAARLLLLREQPQVLDGLEISARLDASVTATRGWRLDAQDLQIRGAGLSLSGSGTLGATAAGLPPTIDARALLNDSDVAVLSSLIGPGALATFGAPAAALTAGRVESAELAWRGPLLVLPWNAPRARFTGSATLRDATLSASDAWPDAAELAAKIDWHGAHFHAAIERARSGTFALTDAVADWDARAGHAARFAGRLEGDSEEAIAWLQSHPQAVAWAPGLERIDLRGMTLLDLEVALPARADAQGRPAPPARAYRGATRWRAAASRSGSPAAGGAAWHARLRGGTPATLDADRPVARRPRDPHARRASRAWHDRARDRRPGKLDARTAAQAAGADDTGLNGSADWSALLTLFPGTASTHWQLHADSSLAGIASRLPEPFAKASGVLLPLHLDLQAGSDRGELRIGLGDRLAGVAALARSGDNWRIERGALRLSGTTPPLPVEPVLALDGRVGRLDLAACLALWRQAARDAALPQLRAHLTAAQLLAGARSFPEVSVTADAVDGGGAVRLQSPALSAARTGRGARCRAPGTAALRPFQHDRACRRRLGGAACGGAGSGRAAHRG